MALTLLETTVCDEEDQPDTPGWRERVHAFQIARCIAAHFVGQYLNQRLSLEELSPNNMPDREKLGGGDGR